MNTRKKELREEYKQTHTPMGIYQIRNLTNDKVFVGPRLIYRVFSPVIEFN